MKKFFFLSSLGLSVLFLWACSIIDNNDRWINTWNPKDTSQAEQQSGWSLEYLSWSQAENGSVETWNNKKSIDINEETNMTTTNINKKSWSETKEIDLTWNRYTNYDLWFTINYPKTSWGKDEVVVNENIDSVDIGWLVISITHQELSEFIDDKYGKWCVFFTQEETDQKDVWDVRLISSDKEWCIFLDNIRIKYRSTDNKIASWTFWHDPFFVTLWSNWEVVKVLDDQVLDTFKFID